MKLNEMCRFLNQTNFGLLLMRLGLGGMMAAVGVSKFLEGAPALEQLGGAMKFVGLDFLPVMWGFFAAASMVGGGFFIIIGFLFRTSCFMIFVTMVVAIVYHVHAGDDLIFGNGAHALKTAIAFFALMLIGPGRFSAQGE
jgi:putative oxidoreductase